MYTIRPQIKQITNHVHNQTTAKTDHQHVHNQTTAKIDHQPCTKSDNS